MKAYDELCDDEYRYVLNRAEEIKIKAGYKEFEILLDALGAEYLLEELVYALTDDELLENMLYIARMQDVDVE